MEEKLKSKKKESYVGEKLFMLISLFYILLFPIIAISLLIETREDLKDDILNKIANEKSGKQEISAPYLLFINPNDSQEQKQTLCSNSVCYDLNIDVDTVMHSIFKFLVFDSEITMKGQFIVDDEMLNVKDLRMQIDVNDRIGLTGKPKLKFDGDEYELTRGIKKKSYYGDEYLLETKVNLNDDVRSGDTIDYEIYMVLGGTGEVDVNFDSKLNRLNVTSNCSSAHFDYDFEPQHYELGEDGFFAQWEVDGMKLSNANQGVRIEINNFPYYELNFYMIASFIIVFIMFIAICVAENVMKKNVDMLKYIIFSVSVIVSNLLLIVLSEMISFGLAYWLTVAITVGIFIPYMSKSFNIKCSVVLGVLLTFTFLVCYLMMNIESIAIIIGVALLYALICIAMCFSATRSKDCIDNMS
jgi:inner membrane protein